MLEALPARFGDLFAVHVAELPGTGRSEGDPTEQSVASVVATVGELAAHISNDPGQVVLFGHSMNGTLALAAAAAGNYAGAIAVTPAPALPPNPEDNAAYWAAKAEPERRRRGAEIIEAYNTSSDAAEKETLREAYNHLRQWYDPDFDSSALDASRDPRSRCRVGGGAVHGRRQRRLVNHDEIRHLPGPTRPRRVRLHGTDDQLDRRKEAAEDED